MYTIYFIQNCVKFKKCKNLFFQADIDEACRTKTSWSDVFKNPVNRKAIVLTSIMMSCQEFMGIDVVLFYVEEIFTSAGTSDAALSAIIIGLVQMVSSVITPIVVDRSGRKVLLIISSIGSGITVVSHPFYKILNLSTKLIIHTKF